MVDIFGGNKPESQETRKIHITQSQLVVEYGFFTNLNRYYRDKNEDDYYIKDDIFGDGEISVFVVFDGHGGRDAVDYCKDNLLSVFTKLYKENPITDVKAFLVTLFSKLDDQLRVVGASENGTCLCLAIVRKEGQRRFVYIANLGDTRAVLVTNGVAQRISEDHKASNNEAEIKRIKDMGGFIMKNRVSGQLAVTRALGDFDLKNDGVICTPYVHEPIEIQKNANQYLIIASDGLWDTCEDKTAADWLKSKANTQDMSEELVNKALENGSRDNTSVLVVRLS